MGNVKEIKTEVVEMSQENRNLNALINKISFELVNNKILEENQINKMLGVLSNDGVYAWWVYSKKELDWRFTREAEKFKENDLIQLLLVLEKFHFLFGKIGKIIEDKIDIICKKQEEIDELRNEIKNLDDKEEKKKKNNKIRELNSEQNDLLNSFFHQLSEDLPSLLFFREILEKILIYARYHAKALGD